MKRLSSLISHLSSLQFKQRFTLIELLVVIERVPRTATIGGQGVQDYYTTLSK